MSSALKDSLGTLAAPHDDHSGEDDDDGEDQDDNDDDGGEDDDGENDEGEDEYDHKVSKYGYSSKGKSFPW